MRHETQRNDNNTWGPTSGSEPHPEECLPTLRLTQKREHSAETHNTDKKTDNETRPKQTATTDAPQRIAPSDQERVRGPSGTEPHSKECLPAQKA